MQRLTQSPTGRPSPPFPLPPGTGIVVIPPGRTTSTTFDIIVINGSNETIVGSITIEAATVPSGTYGFILAIPIAPSDPGYVPPVGFQLTNPAVYYQVITFNVAISGLITLCFKYPSNVPSIVPTLLYHFEGSAWQDITTSRDR